MNIILPNHITQRPAKLYAFWQEAHQLSSKMKKQPSATKSGTDTERTYGRLPETLDSTNGRTLLNKSTIQIPTNEKKKMIRIYTDVSKVERGFGAVVVISSIRIC